MDKKGIFAFLAVTLAMSVIVQAVSMMTPYKFVVYLQLIAPALGAFVARRISPSPAEDRSPLWPIPKLPAVRIAIVTPLVFFAVCAVTTLVGLTKPDWKLGEMMALLLSNANESAQKAFQMPYMPTVMLVLGVLATLLIGPTIIAASLIGIEYGWRGYLLPRLMPLGRWKAYAVLGLMWGMSMAPARIANAAHSALTLLVLMLAMTIVVSAVLGEIWRRTHNIGLTAVFYGCFTTHATALLPFVFPESRVIFPWGGTVGVVSIVVWAIVAAFPAFFFGRLGERHLAQPASEQPAMNSQSV